MTLFALIALAAAVPDARFPVDKLPAEVLDEFMEPEKVERRLQALAHPHHDVALVSEGEAADADEHMTLSTKILRELGRARNAVANALKGAPKLRSEEESLLSEATDRAFAASSLSSKHFVRREAKVAAFTQQHYVRREASTAAVAQHYIRREKKQKVEAKAESMASLQAGAKAALRHYVRGVHKQVQAETQLEAETASAEATIAQLQLPKDILDRTEASLKQVAAIEKNVVAGEKKAEVQAKKFMVRRQ